MKSEIQMVKILCKKSSKKIALEIWIKEKGVYICTRF